MLEPDECIIQHADYQISGEFDGAHVWFCDLDSLGPDCLSALSSYEMAKAMRLKSPLDRRRFLTRCAFIREKLTGLIGLAGESLEFQQTTRGRPQLATPRSQDRKPESIPDFNLSHSENIMGLVAAFDKRVGIDLEVVNPNLDFLQLGGEYLPAEDFDLLLRTGALQRAVLFYRLWTRKEAISKMSGIGIASRDREISPISHRSLYSFEIAGLGKQIIGAVALERRTQG